MPTTDPSDSARWLASRRRSRMRRAEAARRLRRVRGRRSVVGLLAASLAMSGAALADSSSERESTGGTAATHGTGWSVAEVQRRLGVDADGVYGPQTRRAVKRFQRRHGLVVDGVVGPQTLAALGLRPTAQRSTATAGAAGSVLERIATCESGGNPRAISAGGRYRGKYQFSRSTWRALGGKGDPARAPEAVQDRLAARLLAQRGTAPWPNCA